MSGKRSQSTSDALALKRLTPEQIAARRADDPMSRNRDRIQASHVTAASTPIPPTEPMPHNVDASASQPEPATTSTSAVASAGGKSDASTAHAATARAVAAENDTSILTPGSATRPYLVPDPPLDLRPDFVSPGAHTDTGHLNNESRPPHEGELYVFSPGPAGEPLTAHQRRAVLDAMRPTGPAAEVALVKPIIQALVETIPYVSPDSDASMMSIGVSFARYCVTSQLSGDFVPDRDFNEDTLDDFVRLALPITASDGTRLTYKSQIRRLNARRPRRSKSQRKYAAAPHPRRDEQRMWESAVSMRHSNPDVATELCTLFALSFGGGLTGAEIHAIPAAAVEWTGTRAVLRVTRNHWVRDVPVYGKYAIWLKQRNRELDAADHLFRPDYATRANATWALIDQAKKYDPNFDGYKTVRARHAWLIQALCLGIPFNAVCTAAGIGRDSNLPTDLLPYMPTPTPNDIKKAFDHAFRTGDIP